VEGFFDVCRLVGLTGRQGVCMPAGNVRGLVLRKDVRAAIEQGEFHIYPITTVDEGLELLTGIEAGAPRDEGTLHWLVDRRLRSMAADLRSFGASKETRIVAEKQPKESPPGPPKTPDDQP
jgi:hypothetical protein